MPRSRTVRTSRSNDGSSRIETDVPAIAARGQSFSAADLIVQGGERQQRLQRVALRRFLGILRGTVRRGRIVLLARPCGRTNSGTNSTANSGERSCHIVVRFGGRGRHFERFILKLTVF